MQGQCHQTCISHCLCSQYSHVSLFVPCLVKSRVSMFMIKHNRGCLVSSNHDMAWPGIKSIIWRKLIVYLVFALWSVVKELKHDVTCSDAAVSVQGDAVLWQPVIGIIAAPPQLEGGAAHLLNTWDMSLPLHTPGQWLFHITNSSIFQLPPTPPSVPNIYQTFVLTNKFLGEIIINDLDIGLMANFGQFVLKELVVRGGAGAGQRAEFVYLIFWYLLMIKKLYWRENINDLPH